MTPASWRVGGRSWRRWPACRTPRTTTRRATSGEHTLATFAHRKVPDLVLSLGLLLHDAGKPRATPQEGKRFFAHAEIGARVARRFLGRLGFAPRG